MMKYVRMLAIAAATAFGLGQGAAQTYPTRTIKIIVSTSAGGVTDLTARILGQHITAKTGQAVVIDNRSGGSGNIAVEAMTKANPDGYTLGVVNTGNIVINPFLYRLTFDPLNDLVPVGVIGMVPLFLVMNSQVPAKSLQEFIAYAKANPDKINYASAGAGTTPDLAAVEFGRRAGLKLVFVPFRGTAPAVGAVLGGDVQMTFVSMGPHIEFVREGKLRVLGSTTAKRLPYMPEVPTFTEQGFPGFEISTWFALYAPRGTPKEIVDRLNGFVRQLGEEPDARRRLEASFIDPSSMTAEEFAVLVKADAAKWERIVREADIKPAQ